MPSVRYHHGQTEPSKPIQYTFLPPLRLTTSTHDGLLKSIERRVRDNTRRRNEPQGRSQRFYARYKRLLYTIASSLTPDDVTDLKFLCRDDIKPVHLLDEVHNSWTFIILLENKKLLAVNSLGFLQTLLYYIGRTDLYRLVFKFRVDRQKEYKADGVNIPHMLEGTDNDPEKMKLTEDMMEFRRNPQKARKSNKPNLLSLQQKLTELSTKVQNNIIEMRRKVNGDQEPTIQPLKPNDKNDDDVSEDLKEIPCAPDLTKKSSPVGKTSNEAIANVLNVVRNGNEQQNRSKQIINPTKKIAKKATPEKKLECVPQLEDRPISTEELSNKEEYVLSKEAMLAHTPIPPPLKEFTTKANKIYERYGGVGYCSPHPKQEKQLEANAPSKIEQIRKILRKDNLNNVRFYSKRTKDRGRKKKTKTTQPHSVPVWPDSEDGMPLIFPDIYEQFARTSRLPASKS